jgi:DNA mismatch repair protein MutS
MPGAGALTPMMEQYESVKARYPGHLVLFRVGDFYETYGEEARLLSRELEVVLTARSPDARGDRVPMAGVPHHAVESYLGRLIQKGYKVALCDQVEDPKLAKGLVRREVTRVVTPGTVLDERILPGADHNFLASVVLGADGSGGFAAVDVTTGELYSGPAPPPASAESLAEALVPFAPREILLAGEPAARLRLEERLRHDYPRSRIEIAADPLAEVDRPPAFSTEGIASPSESESLARLADYLRTTQPRVLPFVERVAAGAEARRLRIDAKSLRHLEISRPMNPDDDAGPTLLDAFDETVTSAGRRTLAFWLRNPLADVEAIRARQSVVEALAGQGAKVLGLRETLRRVPDLARIGARIAGRRVRPPELLALAAGIAALGEVRRWIAESALEEPLEPWHREFGGLADWARRLPEALADPPPATAETGPLFRTGFDAELDRWRAAEAGALSELESLERRERDASGLRTLKAGYNQIFGYYFEVPRAQADHVPAHFERRQTLAGVERYTSAELRGIEERLLGAREALGARERAGWEELLRDLESGIPTLYRLGRAVGELDVLTTFAFQAQTRGYVRPTVDESAILQIRDGRHPILDRLLRREFVPNDTDLDAGSARLLLLTGPNMSGKSTYMRQVGLLVVLAQVGSFVPARYARIGVVSGLFTRMGFADAIGRGKSSFLVEMSEVAEILRGADPRSLVLLDEVGRGTSTFDGVAIAWATLKELHDRTRCRTVVATHYHQLTDLVAGLPAARNAHLAVRETGGAIQYLRTLVPGATDRSLGLHVARLAGLPDRLLDEASRLLRHLEREGADLVGSAGKPRTSGLRYTQAVLVAGPPDAAPNPLEADLRGLDLDRLSPIDAHRWLVDRRRRLEAPAERAPPP